MYTFIVCYPISWWLIRRCNKCYDQIVADCVDIKKKTHANRGEIPPRVFRLPVLMPVHVYTAVIRGATFSVRVATPTKSRLLPRQLQKVSNLNLTYKTPKTNFNLFTQNKLNTPIKQLKSYKNKFRNITNHRQKKIKINLNLNLWSKTLNNISNT